MPRWIVVSVRKVRDILLMQYLAKYSSNESRAQNVTTGNMHQFFLRISLKAFFPPIPLDISQLENLFQNFHSL